MNQTEQENREPNYQSIQNIAEDDQNNYVAKIDVGVFLSICIPMLFANLVMGTLNPASVFGLIDDLNLVGNQFNLSASMINFGTLVGEWPAMYLMCRLPLTKLTGTAFFLLGIEGICVAFTKTHVGLGVVFFFMGLTQSVLYPACLSIISIWYQKEDHPLRVGTFLSMDFLAQILSNLLMYGVAKTELGGIPAWRLSYIIAGCLCSACGIFSYCSTPSTPLEAWFLSEAEKIVITKRMEGNREGGDKTGFSISQLKETLLDMKAWLCLAFGVLYAFNGPVDTISALIINNLGYDKLHTALLNAPSGAVQLVSALLAYLGSYLFPRNRCLVAMLLLLPPLAGNILLHIHPSEVISWVMVIASWLASSTGGAYITIMSITTSNIKGNTKRAIVNSCFFIGSSVSGIVSMQLWPPSAAPYFSLGVNVALASLSCLIGFLGLYWALCYTENRHRDQRAIDEWIVAPSEGDDITDKQDRLFRYTF